MLTFIRKRYRNFVLNSRYYYSVIVSKLKTPFAIGAIAGFFIYLGISYYGLDLLISLVYDEEVAEVIDFRILYFLSMFLAATLYINLVVMVKIIWDRIRRSPGTLLRFRVIGFFFLSILLPAILFIVVFNTFFDRSIAIFDNQAILRTMENKKWILTQDVELHKNNLSREFDYRLEMGFSNFSSSSLSYVGVHNLDGERLYHYKKNNFSLQSVPPYPITSLVSSSERIFTSYDMDRGFIYQIRQQTYQGKKYYFVIIDKASDYLKNDIKETFLVIRQVKQFELLLYPFKIFTIIFLIYVYSQIFSVLAIVFYYSSNRYMSPIAALIKATREIIKGNYKNTLHRLTKHMGNNEIKELLLSFSRMSREILNYRRRLERISNIEAWKEVSQRLAHEIKNPLTPILLAKDQIEKHLQKTDFQGYHQMQENFAFIDNEIRRIQTLLDEFNILAQQKLIRLEWVETEELMKGLQRLVGRYSFIKWVGEDRFQKPVYLDKDKMMRVFVNLLRNSIESLEELRSRKTEKGRDFIIKVVIYSEEVENSFQDDDSKTGFKNWVFEFWDNGTGIPEEKKNEIFKPYVTFKSKGTGLGLAICDEIVTLHQGVIEVFSLEEGYEEEDENYGGTALEEENFNPQGEFSGQGNDRDRHYWTVFRITLPYSES